jgi:hypothetical protein
MTITITIREARGGRYVAHHDGQVVCTSSSPFVDGARVLLARGHDPADRFVMRREGRDQDDLIGTLGTAAGLYVRDTRHGTSVFRTWKASSGVQFASPVAPNEVGATQVLNNKAQQSSGARSQRLPRAA